MENFTLATEAWGRVGARDVPSTDAGRAGDWLRSGAVGALPPSASPSPFTHCRISCRISFNRFTPCRSAIRSTTWGEDNGNAKARTDK